MAKQSRKTRGWLCVLLIAIVLPVPAVAPGAECAGDECQAPPPAPEEVIPATSVVTGPSNPPVRFPRHSKRHKRHRHRSHRPGR